MTAGWATAALTLWVAVIDPLVVAAAGAGGLAAGGWVSDPTAGGGNGDVHRKVARGPAAYSAGVGEGLRSRATGGMLLPRMKATGGHSLTSAHSRGLLPRRKRKMHRYDRPFSREAAQTPETVNQTTNPDQEAKPGSLRPKASHLPLVYVHFGACQTFMRYSHLVSIKFNSEVVVLIDKPCEVSAPKHIVCETQSARTEYMNSGTGLI